jgi:predicted transport protein
MGDVKLFKVSTRNAEELHGRSVKKEKQLQTLLETHLDTFLGIRFLATEYSTGKTHAGRIDTLGLDEDFCPVIIEYKRHANANVINQGLFYLDWLMDHKAEFEQLVQKKCGPAAVEKIDWSGPRLVCIAEDFTRYDVHAIQQIDRSIELMRYKYFGEDLFLLDLVNAVVATPIVDDAPSPAKGGKAKNKYTSQEEYLAKASPQLKEIYEAVRDHIIELADDVQERMLKWYIAYKQLRNFATVQLQPAKHGVMMWLSIDPKSVTLEDGFSRDVSQVGHHGTGDLQLRIHSLDDLEKAKPLIQRSFEEN